jgi:hypothetical protein
VSAVDAGDIVASAEFNTMGPIASFVAANAAGVAVGSSRGGLYVFNSNGTLREARVLGDGDVRAALRPDGSLGAVHYSDTLFFFSDNRIVNTEAAIGWPRGLTMLGDDVVFWNRTELQLMNAYGQLQWSVEFSKSISSVATRGDTLVCGVGVLTAFRRRIPRSDSIRPRPRDGVNCR